MANQDIDHFIRSLNYDPRIILAVAPDGDVSTLPLTTSQTGNNEVVVCKTIQHKLTKNLSEVAILSQGAVAFPGALLVADAHLQSGAPTPIGLPRAKLTLTVDLPGLQQPSGQVDPTTSGVQTFLNEKLEEWNKLTEGNQSYQNYRNAARSILNYSTAYTRQQVAASLGFKAEWASGAASAQLDVSSTTERSVVLCYYKQVFYTVKVNTPAAPSDVFDSSVTLVDVRDVVSNSAPPAYVDSVDYGRILLVKMETSAVDTSVNLQGAFKQATQGGVTASGDLKAKYDDITKNATFTAVASAAAPRKQHASSAAQPPASFRGSRNTSTPGGTPGTIPDCQSPTWFAFSRTMRWRRSARRATTPNSNAPGTRTSPSGSCTTAAMSRNSIGAGPILTGTAIIRPMAAASPAR